MAPSCRQDRPRGCAPALLHQGASHQNGVSAMKGTKRTRLNLEHLESRWCPALNVFFDAQGNLLISGTPTAPANTLNLTQMAPGVIEVLDDATSLGTYTVSGTLRTILGNSATTLTVNLDLMTFAFGGSVDLRAGNALQG